MAGIGANALTYLDWAKRIDPDGKIPVIVEALSEYTPAIVDAAVVQGNLTTGHRTVVRTGLPTPTWRLLNYGVQPSKSTTKQVDDQCGMLEGYSEIDIRLLELSEDEGRLRMSEDHAFFESMAQEMEETLFYGDTGVTPQKYMGLSPRYNAHTGSDRTVSSYNVIAGGGAGADNASIWFVTWNDRGTFMTFPKGSMAGFKAEDLGQQRLFDASGNPYEGKVTHYRWDLGLVVRDWRFNSRICNLDISQLIAGSGATVDGLFKNMILAKNRIRGQGRRLMYCNETVHSYLEVLAMEKTNVHLSIQQYAGEDILSFRGIPIRIADRLNEAEDLVPVQA
jgi:hypothetical protein